MLRTYFAIAILVVILEVTYNLGRGGAYSVLSTPPKVPDYLIWSQAARKAVERKDFNILAAFYDSNISLAKDSAVSVFSEFKPSSDALSLLLRAFKDKDLKTKYHAMHGIYEIASSENYDMRKNGVIFPAYRKYNERPELYLIPWQAWIDSNGDDLFRRISSHPL